MKVYAVYDSKAQAYLQPFFTRNKGLALRAFQAAINDAQHDFSKYAADYTLFEIGEFDEDSGVLKGHVALESLGCALEYKAEVAPVAALREVK